MSYTEVIKWLGPIGLMLDIFGSQECIYLFLFFLKVCLNVMD